MSNGKRSDTPFHAETTLCLRSSKHSGPIPNDLEFVVEQSFALMFQLVKIYMQNTIRTLKVHDFVQIAID